MRPSRNPCFSHHSSSGGRVPSELSSYFMSLRPRGGGKGSVCNWPVAPRHNRMATKPGKIRRLKSKPSAHQKRMRFFAVFFVSLAVGVFTALFYFINR
jgi:hypothetical protein